MSHSSDQEDAPDTIETARVDALRRLGLSDGLLRLSGGEKLHAIFEYRCAAPPGMARFASVKKLAAGGRFYSLWECGIVITGLQVRDARLAFVRFDPETGELDWLAGSEQGLWAQLFLELFEDHDELDREGFRAPAAAVGFCHLDFIIDAYEAADHSRFEAHDAFVEATVAAVDDKELGPGDSSRAARLLEPV